MSIQRSFKLGLIVNPYAGMGGPLGQKGSDLLASKTDARDDNRAAARGLRCLKMLAESGLAIEVLGFDGLMAGALAKEAGLPFQSVGRPQNTLRSYPEDTENAAARLKAEPVDLILFIGGDGTARDVCRGVGEHFPVLGLPAGVKMHSGVYAISPESATEIILGLINGELVELAQREVRDIDEAAFTSGAVRSRYFAEMLVPALGGFLQNVKIAGRESEELVLTDIADYLLEEMTDDCLYLIGPGSTTEAIMDRMGLRSTLLGFDAVLAGELLDSDVDAAAIANILDQHRGPVKVVMTLIGGQGHILGRGNQQLTPALIRRIGRDNFMIVASKGKISALAARPLLVDSNDPKLDKEWEGFIPVITGYRDTILYPVGLGHELRSEHSHE